MGLEKFSEQPLRSWQYNLLKERMMQPEDRKIIWFCDQQEGCGKTWATKACFSKFECIRFENSKSADIKHAYNGEKVVFFDLTRSQLEHFNYEAMESVKNGIMFSSKYDSAMKIFDSPHVVVMANWAPDTSKLNDDRWDIRNINRNDLECHLINKCLEDIEEPKKIKEEPPSPIVILDSEEEDIERDACSIFVNMPIARNIFGHWQTDSF